MEEDPLIPLVHVWNNAAFDHASASSSAWHAHTAAAAAVASVSEGDKENHRPEPEAADVDAEIDHIEAEILRLSSRLHHLRTSKQPEPKRGEAAPARAAKAAARPRTRGLSMGPLDVIAAANPNPPLLGKEPPRAAQGLKPIKPAPAPRGRGFSLGPLDIIAANPRVPAAAAPQRKVHGEGGIARPILKPIKEPPVQRRRGVSLGPLEIHHGVGSKPGAAAAARVKPFSKLSAVREEGQHSKQHAVPSRPWPSSNARQPLDAKQGAAPSRAKARGGSMSPRSRRQSTSKAAETRGVNAKATETRGGNAKATDTRGGNAAVAVNKVADELKPKAVVNHAGNAAVVKRPAGSSKVRVVPSRYSLTPGSSLAAGTQEKRRKQSLPGSAGGASQREEIRAKLTEQLNDELSPETIAKVAVLLPRIRTMPPSDESPRDSGCAKRVADLVGKRSFFTAAVDDGNAVTPFQARVLEVESPEAAEEEA
ncbi:hypothetical protein PAHAL_4G039700 [Panicum hallii]|jgi:hypothetical protein|uniref:Uncharacterized protein n=1 Tax=Panicum hallii TaxID=206008 RepID=A0A2S3HGY7_9POAL|nr:uncharacterized protein LOC112889961 [Panicum hallii]XP_025812554.1 uncharacterized protein LOC112889961 [Panicum hallii]PAN22712.1 hypothetical protein PAHAL_4G039700 [Panicum hallii]PAN22715.2 hypothetical protein PAHAL_4G039700 [Panicum hallii]